MKTRIIVDTTPAIYLISGMAIKALRKRNFEAIFTP